MLAQRYGENKATEKVLDIVQVECKNASIGSD